MQSPDDKPLWQILESLLAKLKPAQRALAQSFVDQARRSATGHIPLTELLQSHFGDNASNRALAGLRQSKKRLNEELAALGAGIELVVDESGKLETRTCYLQAPASKGAEIEELADVLNYDRDRGKHVAPKARPLNESVTVEIPISYSHVNKKLVRELHERLQKVLDARQSKARHFLRRDERDTELSAPFDPQIAALFKDGSIALFMLSVDFFDSGYCQKKEVPKFIDTKGKNRKGKRAICVPVALEHPHLEHVPKKFKQRVIAFHEGSDERKKSWRQLCEEGRASDKDAYLHYIADEIIKAAEALAWPDDPPPDGSPSGRRDKRRRTEDAIHELAGLIPKDIDVERCTQLRAKHLGTLDRNHEDGLAASADEAGVDLIPTLIEWAKDQTAPPFCALLGEYGTGKTVSCQMLADQVNTERKKPESGALPLALYFDLRRVDSKRLGEFAVEPIIEQLLKSADHAHKLKARELIDWVRVNPALVIFDGLDEVLVHLNPKQGQDFTRALWSIYPPSHWQRYADKDAAPIAAPANRPNTVSKLLMSCRSHYFRTIADERALLVGQDRESIRASDYRAYLILPFNDEQILDYLKRNFPQRDPARTIALIADIHNLKELAQRPVLLRHIGAELAALEQRKIAGQAINTAVLYGLFVERWLSRDDAKHQLSLPHKEVLMEHLAAELTRRGVRELGYERVEDWLDRFIAARPKWEGVYRATDREILKEDLRTATFIVRPDEKKFRFAHTSLQEYFLAGYLLHGLMAGEADSCRLPPPSSETFNFFAERWQVADADHDDRLPDAQRTLAALLEQAAPGRSETAFAAWLALHRLGLQPLRPAGFDLSGCDLSGWAIGSGAEGLTLGAANFSHANLMQSRWQGVQLEGVRLDQANLSDSEWHEAHLDNATARGADLDGAIFRHSRLVNADFSEAEHSGAHYLFCERTGAQLPPTPPHRIAPSEDNAALAVLWPQQLTGHTGWVSACGFSADGRWLASGGDDGTLRLWDVAGRREAHRFEGHNGQVSACGFSADGCWLVSGGEDGAVRLWDVAGRREAHCFEGHTGWVSACGFSADGRWMVSGGADGAVRLWDVAGRREAHCFEGHTGWVSACGFSADGRWLASGGEDGAVRLWDLAGRREAHCFEGHTGAVRACGFSADGHWLASGGDDGAVRLWDVAGRREAHRFEGHAVRVFTCKFSTDGRWLASGGGDSAVRVWDVAGRCEAHRFEGHSGWVFACDFSVDGRWLASGGEDGAVRLWDVAGRRETHRFKRHIGAVKACGFSADGRWLASGDNDGTLRLWDVAGRHEAHCFAGPGWVSACGFSADGRWLASGGADGAVRLWDVDRRREAHRFEGHTGWVSACGFSADGRWLASGGSDGTLRLWDVAGRCEAHRFEGHTSAVRACGFSADGRWLATGGEEDGTLRLWDLAGRREAHCFEGHAGRVLACGFSADGRWLASGGDDGAVRLWDVAGRCEEHSFKGHSDQVLTCGFSADGRWLASGGGDGAVRLWDVAGRCEEHSFEGHTGRVSACGFSVDGRWLASGGGDGAVRLWDVADRVCRAVFYHLPNGETASADLDRGRFIAATPNAWRYLGYGGLIDGEWQTYPAEVFGAIPPMGEIGMESL